jgi:hypothetical protein
MTAERFNWSLVGSIAEACSCASAFAKGYGGTGRYDRQVFFAKIVIISGSLTADKYILEAFPKGPGLNNS